MGVRVLKPITLMAWSNSGARPREAKFINKSTVSVQGRAVYRLTLALRWLRFIETTALCFPIEEILSEAGQD
jgi:hypothetical protein